MNPKQLKNSILQYAMQGKLTPPDLSDEPVNELITRIKEEKKQLIKAKIIKDEKVLPQITEDEIPFDIPTSWEWVRAAEVMDVRDGTHDTPKYVKEGIPLVTSKNLKNGNLIFEPIKYISTDDHIEISKRSKVDNGDILFAMIGSIGNPVVVKKDREFSIKNVGLFKALPQNKLNMDFVFYYLTLMEERLKREASGAVQSFVSLSKLRQLTVPLPPLEEQKRIVRKIQELMKKVEEYSILHEEQQKLRKVFPSQLEKSILQYAVQGKLVSQDVSNEPASELIQRIKEEKEQLIKDKVIKKDKALPEITEGEIPFDIPDSWEWVRLGELVSKIGSGSTPLGGKAAYVEKGIVFIRSQNVWNDGLKLDNVAYIPEEINSKKAGSIVRPNDLLINITGASIGRCSIVPSDFLIGNVNQHVCILRLIDIEIKEYLHYCLMSPYIQQTIMDSQVGVSREGLSMAKLKMFLIPLPSLEEQKRIVEKVKELQFVKERLVKCIDGTKY
ncbi:restriction endonuclease subunit S [Rummeliibacillus pycnus]|uniref:restriction endonuclease subunit S n=1 Tax=Rummeliibacillus pycnus TaxID=101070 RepID=UPI000C9A8C84|nr:restriction endonuclease subunit S [Rummeliibacillus pycnus]